MKGSPGWRGNGGVCGIVCGGAEGGGVCKKPSGAGKICGPAPGPCDGVSGSPLRTGATGASMVGALSEDASASGVSLTGVSLTGGAGGVLLLVGVGDQTGAKSTSCGARVDAMPSAESLSGASGLAGRGGLGAGGCGAGAEAEDGGAAIDGAGGAPTVVSSSSAATAFHMSRRSSGSPALGSASALAGTLLRALFFGGKSDFGFMAVPLCAVVGVLVVIIHISQFHTIPQNAQGVSREMYTGATAHGSWLIMHSSRVTV